MIDQFDLLRGRALALPMLLFVTVAFFMLYGSPTAAAVHQSKDQQDRQQMLEDSLIPASAAGKFGHFLDQLKQDLVPGAGLRLNQAPRTPDWSALQAQLNDLDQLFRTEWQTTLHRFEQAQVADKIIARHHEVLDRYEERHQRFMSYVVDRNLDGMTAMLADMQTRPTHKQNNFEHPSFAVMEPDPDNVPRAQEELSLMAQEAAGPLKMDAVRHASLGLAALRDAANPEYLAETPEVVITPAIEAKAAELDHDPIRIYHFVRNEIDFLPGWGATQDAELTLGARRGNAKDTSSLLIALLRASGIPARYVYGVIEVEAPKFTNWMGNFGHVNAAMQHASSGGIPVGMSSSNNASVTNVILEHVWVEAAIDDKRSQNVASGWLTVAAGTQEPQCMCKIHEDSEYRRTPSGARAVVLRPLVYSFRRSVHPEADTWVALDASFKQYVYLQGLDAIEIAELDVEQLVDDFAASGTVDEELGYVQNLDISLIEAAQEQVADAMQDFIEEQMDDPTTGDVLGGRKTILQERGELTERPDNRILLRGASWPSLPDVLRNSLRVTFEVDYLTGQPQGGVVLPWAQVNNHRLTMSYRPTTEADEQALLALLPEGEITDLDQLPQTLPGHSISLTPEIKLNGEIILTGPTTVNAFTLETMLAFEVQQLVGNTKWGIPFQSPIPKGSYVAIMANAGSVSTHALEAARQRAEEAQYILENELQDHYDQVDRERLMGDLFYAGVLTYHAQLEGFGGLTAAKMGAEYRTNLSVGTYGYQPWVRYVYGMPMALDAGGVHMDLDYVPSHLTKRNGSASQAAMANQPLGMLKSVLENLVPEQQFSTEEEPAEGVSAVAAIAKAQAEGQRVFHVTQENLNEALAEISISPESRLDIQRAVSQFGYEAIVHEAPVTVPGWRGSGYILTDPETGAGSYMIYGGKNGGNHDGDGELLLASFSSVNIENILELVSIIARKLGLPADLVSAWLECEGAALYVAWLLAWIVAVYVKLFFVAVTCLICWPFVIALLATIAIGVFMSMVIVGPICRGYDQEDD